MFKGGFGHLVRAEGFQGCVMKQHRLMKQQTTITRQTGSRVQQKRICLLFLSLPPFQKSPLISLFPCVVHIASSLLQARAVKCMCEKKLLFPYWERPWENILVYSEITGCCCKNLYKAPGGRKTRKYFSLITQGLGAVVLQEQLMYVSAVEVNVNCVMEVLRVT